MKVKALSPQLSVSPQLSLDDVRQAQEAGFKTLICNRPDGEGPDQTTFVEIQRLAEELGMQAHYQPIISGQMDDEHAAEFGRVLAEAETPVLAYCRTGTRSTNLWALSQAADFPADDLLRAAQQAGYNITSLRGRLLAANPNSNGTATAEQSAPDVEAQVWDVLIIGGGAGGIAAASSLLARDCSLKVAIVDPSENHYYQPGWTLVGGGVFQPETTQRRMKDVVPSRCRLIAEGVESFQPDEDKITLCNGQRLAYKALVVSPGLKLNWEGVEGLPETLGRNGVTSNYRYDLAPYTWKLVQETKGGTALFTQPPMPIKCAGAPQKAMYLSAHEWEQQGALKNIKVEFNNAGGVLFGVKDYVPALMEYIERYGIDLAFNSNLVAVDGPNKRATFEVTDGDGKVSRVEKPFDMLHVCPPQIAPDFIRVSPLAAESGWMDVDQYTLRSTKFENVWGLGDVISAPNAKTAAAVRKQAPVVAENVLRHVKNKTNVREALYRGYGSCPLTVERGKIVLAEFGYGGVLEPSFPRFIINGTRPSRVSWWLKERILPPIYWNAMLKGREWLARPVYEKE